MTQVSRPARIGAIFHRGPEATYTSLQRSLANLGYAEGRDIVFEPRFAYGQLDRTPQLASELVELGVDVIVAVGAVGARAAQKATASIPIAFAIVVDPAATGLVASNERPGGNVTGVTNFAPDQAHEQLELLRAALPSLRRVAILSDEDVPRGADGWNTLEKSNDMAARTLGVELCWIRMKGPAPELAHAITMALREQADALVVLEVPVTLSRFKEIGDLATARGLPTMLPAGDPGGALMSYGTSLLDTIPSLASHVDRILKGTDPGVLPIETVSCRKLALNLKTARVLGVAFPSEMLRKADQIIE